MPRFSDRGPLGGDCEELQLCGLGGECLSPTFSQLRCLRYLWLNENKLRCLSPLAACPNLKELHADHNEILSVPYLPASRTTLQVLSLASNKIQPLAAQLAALATFARLKCLCLKNNPLAAEPLYR